MEIIDQKILHDSVRWPLSPLYEVRALPGEITKEESAAGDIVIANEDGVKKIIKQSEYTTNNALYTENGYQPIAVVVVPASHTDDGTARCMSLKWMTTQSKTGSDSHFAIDWGTPCNCGTQDIAGLDYFKYRVHGTTTISDWGYSTFFATPSNSASWGGNGYLNLSLDPGAPVARATPAISPYDTDGVSKNPDWFVEGGVGDYMNGKENTAAIISYINTNSNHISNTWLTDEAIQNTTDIEGGNFPAAMSCYRYYTTGTNQGLWYLPSIGELAYVGVRNKEIVDGLILCNVIYDSNSFSYYIDGRYVIHSSTGIIALGYRNVMYAIGGNGTYTSISKEAGSNVCVAFIKI